MKVLYDIVLKWYLQYFELNLYWLKMFVDCICIIILPFSLLEKRKNVFSG